MSQPFLVTATARRAFDRMAADCLRVFGPRFVALVASSPTTSVLFTQTIVAGDLEALGALTETWHREELATPLVLTADEFRRSLDAFPLEYQAMADRHVVIAGEPPFANLVVDARQLRRACEVQAKSHLIHLRQGWIDAGAHEDQLAALIANSAPPLHALLANVARLSHLDGEHRHGALAAARRAGLDEPLVAALLALEAHPGDARHLVGRLPDYLRAAEQLWHFIDNWDL